MQGSPESGNSPLLEVEGLKTYFPVTTGLLSSIRFDRKAGRFPLSIDRRTVKAVDGVNFSLKRGETLGVVGESGCGKSTLGRTILGLDEPTAGVIRFDGVRVEDIDESTFRNRTSMVFQDPQASLNPRRKVGHIIEDPLEGAGWSEAERRERSLELLEAVGLKREYYNRYPHEFSGGQQQRINLARALSINPDLVVADEPVSGLDVSVQAQILKLMDQLQEEFDLTYLFVSHDLSVIRYVADRVAVMYLGKFVEVAPADRLFRHQYHPYARALLGAVPNPNPDTPGVRSQISGNVPSASDPPRGCRFHTRCPEFILPDGFSQIGYDRYEQMLQAVRNRELSEHGETVDAVVNAFLADGDVPSAAVNAAREGIRAAIYDDWDRGVHEIARFESPCQRDIPPLESVGVDGHDAACHLPFEDPIGTEMD